MANQQNGFGKFINNEPKGAKKKEMVRVEKRKAKAEAKLVGDQRRKEKWEKQHNMPIEDKPTSNFKTKTAIKPENKLGNKSARAITPINKFTKPIEKSNSDIYFNRDIATQTNTTESKKGSEEMPLNKYIAHCGVCGRREAADMVKQKLVTVNGDIVYEPGYKVTSKDVVTVKGKVIFLQKNLVYVLLNKPKDYITTASDPQGRKTVLDLTKTATKERIYPVGRLDRNTTGVLLLTNDGELAQKLTHPSFEIKKVYEIKLDKPLAKKDFDAVLDGVMLEDGLVKADALAYADDKDKSIVGIEIHSGRNRIVRRIFEHLGYDVKGLDRVMFANLTKKNVDRGTWRMLAEKEIRLLKFMNQSFLKKAKDKQVADHND